MAKAWASRELVRCLKRYWLTSAIAVVGLWSLSSAPAWAKHTPRKPKVRAITAFVRIDREHYAQQIQEAIAMLRPAKAAFEKGGYEVETIRITTQPFPQYIQGIGKQAALDFFHALDAFAKKESLAVNIGPAISDEEVDPAGIELLGEILATTELNSSVVVAGADGIHWDAIRAAARVMKYLEEHSRNGVGNFGFAAAAMVAPYGPFFPASNHHGAGHQFSVGLEAGNFVADVFEQAHGDFGKAARDLSQSLSEQARALETIAVQVQQESDWTYMGLDATPAPASTPRLARQWKSSWGRRLAQAAL